MGGGISIGTLTLLSGMGAVLSYLSTLAACVLTAATAVDRGLVFEPRRDAHELYDRGGVQPVSRPADHRLPHGSLLGRQRALQAAHEPLEGRGRRDDRSRAAPSRQRSRGGRS